MNYPMQAVSANGIAAVLLGTLLLNFRRNYRRDLREHVVFLLMVLINILQCVVEPITIVLDGKLFPGAVPLLTALNVLLYMDNILFALLWSVYADCKILRRLDPKWRSLKLLPAAVVLLGSFANLFTPVFFSVSAENVYSRTGLFLVPYAATYFYLLLGTFTVYRGGWKGEKYVFLPAVAFLLPVVAASIIQYLYPGISLLWVGAAVGLNSAYICVLDENSSVDSLSGTFTRQYMNLYLNSLSKQAAASKPVAGIMLDIDKFKSINDRFGHLVGDDAITHAGRLLRHAVGARGTVFRYAGDEFTVLLNMDDTQEVEAVIRSIRQEAERFNRVSQKTYQLHFSIGHTLYVPGESISGFLKRMDDAMYEEKKLK